MATTLSHRKTSQWLFKTTTFGVAVMSITSTGGSLSIS
jgi:hypothetical protein